MNRSIWVDVSSQKFPSLSGTYRTDVAVLGGGIAGITTALILRERGRSVLLVDKGDPGMSGESMLTTAHLSELLDTRFSELIRDFGKETAQEIAAASRRGLDGISQRVRHGVIACEFQALPAFLFTEKVAERKILEEEYDALQSLGICARALKAAPLPFATAGCLEIPEQAQFHPAKYMGSLLRSLRDIGGLVFANSPVTKIRHGEPCEVQTESAKILAKEVVVCTNDPISHPVWMHTKIASYRSYACAALTAASPGSPGLYWDLDDPYHYLRCHATPTGKVLIIGGEDHKTGLDDKADERFEKLKRFADARFGVHSVASQWSGQIIEPMDGLPYIGRDSHEPHIYIATGFSGNGMTWGTFAAELIADQVLGVTNRWSELFTPNRLNATVSAGTYVSENKDFPICFLGDRFREPLDIDDIANQEGGIVRMGSERVAVYKTSSGEARALSPICPHMGCYVRWNGAEKTWDCPCHGSRFDTEGLVLNGPAMECLKPMLLDSQIEKIAVGQGALDRSESALR